MTIKHPVVDEFIRAKDDPSEKGFLIEGLNFVNDIGDEDLKYVFYEETFFEADNIHFKHDKSKIYVVPSYVMKKLSDTKNIQKAIALVQKRDKYESNKYVLLNGIQDPGNVGTIIRNAAAFDYNVILDRKTANPYKEKVVRSSAGAVLNVHIEIVESLEDRVDNLIKKGVFVATAELSPDSESMEKIEKRKDIAFILGNESKGIDRSLSEKVNRRFIIPINTKRIESLNVAAAASIIMYNFQ